MIGQKRKLWKQKNTEIQKPRKSKHINEAVIILAYFEGNDCIARVMLSLTFGFRSQCKKILLF